MDQLSRLQEQEGIVRVRGSGVTTTSGHFLQDSLKASIDLPAYISWQTLSSDVTHRLRQGSVRINRSNQLEFTSIEEGKSEKTPLIDQIASRQRKSPDSPNKLVRYPDINSNESVQSNGKY